ncbi:MAG: helix-turn-helix transcriptional regulator [Clostridia bacterium]|nr:helix-turn-helix transcriptional regulator [Clostridia bacterium]
MSKDQFLINMGIRISQRRKELRLTQEQLAEKMGLSLQSISCIELGKKAIRPENLANLCTHLEVSSDYILFGVRTEKQTNETITKLSSLPQQSYQAVENLIDLLYEKQS